MDELFGGLLAAVAIVVACNVLPFGANDVDITEIRAAEAHCSSHGGIKYFDNDYIREVVCDDGLTTEMLWIRNKYATP